jgi:hypothetical protein
MEPPAMNRSYILYAAVITAPLVVKSLLFRGRRRNDPEYILTELRRLPCSVSVEDSEMWSMDKDSAFWQDIQGMRGLWRLRRKAIHLRDFVCSLDLPPEDADEMAFISHRCYWITTMIAIQLALLPFSNPHFAARWAASLYAEIRTRSLTLCSEYNRPMYDSLRVLA